ncbi:MAG: M24 family metallopeptidase, partial [Lawsonibacter sp.]
FSWLTGGRGFVGMAAVTACAVLVVTPRQVFLVTENIEAQRLWYEQLDENPLVKVQPYPWLSPGRREEILRELCGEAPVLTEENAAEELQRVRTVMTPWEITRYRELGRLTAQGLEEVCRTLRPGITEYEFTGELSRRFWADNLEPTTLLVGFDERALRFRHPVPAGAKLKNYALVAVCTRRCGLIVSATRLVCVKKDEVMERRQQAAAQVNAVLCAGSRPGTDTADLFTRATQTYSEAGYPGEWDYHHQGGLTGYLPREWKARADLHHLVREGEVYAWNPSVQGAKAENTVLVTKNGVENLTHTGNWPYIRNVVDGQEVLTEAVLTL